jgi:Xaa-Pro dipeptidase
MAVDWEARVDFERLRTYRVKRVRQALERSEIGALLLYETANIRYVTSTIVGAWSVGKLMRYALITRTGEPHIWDFGSAALNHRLHSPWLVREHSRGGNTGLLGAIRPQAGLPARAAQEIKASVICLSGWTSSKCRCCVSSRGWASTSATASR